MRDARSPRTVRLKAAAFLSAVVLALTGCGAPAPAPASGGPTSAPATSGPGGTTPATASLAPSTGGSTGITITDADRAALADPTTVRVAEHEARLEAAIAERSGQLAILGPDGVEWLAKDRSNALRKVLDSHEVKLTDRGSLRLTSAAMATGDELAAPRDIAGAAVFGATFTVTALVSLVIESPPGPYNPGVPSTSTSTSQQTVGGQRISTTTTTTNTVAWSGSTVTADLTLNQAVTTADAATGAAIGTTTNRVHVHAEANGCPDAAGVVLVRLDVEYTGDASGMAGGSVTEMRSRSETKGQVDDAANLASVTDQVDMSYTTSANGTRRTATATTGLALPTGATQQIDDGDVPPAEAADARSLIVMLTAMTAGTILTFAERKWQGGACVRVDATTARVRQLSPNEVVNFTAKVVHVIEGNDLDKPIVATLTGEGTLAPVDTSERPPVSYTYTAPSQKDKVGTALLKSTSNRGIGLLNLVFRTVIKGWRVDGPSFGGRIQGQHCGDEDGEWVLKSTYTDRFGQKGTQKWTIHIDRSAMTGTYTYTDDARQVIAGITIVTTGKANGTVSLTIDDEGNAQMHFDEKKHTFSSLALVPGARPGKDQNAPLADFDQTWEPDETCP